MLEISEQLKNIFNDRLKLNEPLSAHTTFRVGGPAKWFVEAKGTEEIIRAIELARSNEIDYVVIGGGTNILAMDCGYDGLVIKMMNQGVRVDKDRVIAESGTPMSLVARSAAKAGLSGFEWAVTIPGTIGGAVYGNAGCFGGEMKDVVESVRVLRDGEVVELSNQKLEFGYRHSALKSSSDIVLEVTLKLEPGDKDAIESKMQELIQKRKESQPLGVTCAGCTFKNFEYQDESEIDILKRNVADIPKRFLQNKIISAGWLIDQVGMKGEAIGGASVSTEHGNFIINDGTATADQIVQLISKIKMKVRDELGIQLQEEVQYI